MMLFASEMMARIVLTRTGSGFMALRILWTVLIDAALVGLILLFTRDNGLRWHREIPSTKMRSQLAYHARNHKLR